MQKIKKRQSINSPGKAAPHRQTQNAGLHRLRGGGSTKISSMRLCKGSLITVVGQFKGCPVETRGPYDFPAYTSDISLCFDYT